MTGTIRTGIGGWTFEPWRGAFYPADLARAKQQHFATRHLGTIEINGTFYRTQKPETFAKWRDIAPDGFVYSVKALQYSVARKKLAEGEDSIRRFLTSGLSELGNKLGPILWQFRETRQFDPDDIAEFLALLPARIDGVAVRHVLEARHPSFACPEFVALARHHGVAIVVADHERFPQIADLTADFVYARLMRTQEEITTGYATDDLEGWAKIAKGWAGGVQPKGLNYVTKRTAAKQPRDSFVYFISGAKVRNPAAAMALADLISPPGAKA